MIHEQIPDYISDHLKLFAKEYCNVFDRLSVYKYWKHPHELTNEQFFEVNSELSALWSRYLTEGMTEMLER